MVNEHIANPLVYYEDLFLVSLLSTYLFAVERCTIPSIWDVCENLDTHFLAELQLRVSTSETYSLVGAEDEDDFHSRLIAGEYNHFTPEREYITRGLNHMHLVYWDNSVKMFTLHNDSVVEVW